MFKNLGNHGRKFDFDSSSLPFVKLAELPIGKNYIVKAVFINNKSKFGPSGVVVTEDSCVNVPKYLISDIELILSNDEYIKGINEGKCVFRRIDDYTDKYGNTHVSGTFDDI